MDKKQKIWLAVFLAMFLLPEILWGLCGNFLYNMVRLTFSLGESKIFYSLFQFPDSSHSKVLLVICLFAQLIGLFGMNYFAFKIKNNIKYLLLFFLFALVVVNIFFLIFIFNFNPQLG